MTQQWETGCIFMVAGEASGDLHGSNLTRAIQETMGSVFICGIGGDRMRKAGVRILVDAAELSVVGITEVVSRLPGIWRGWQTVKHLLRGLRPDLVILIDFPDFNFRVAGLAKKLDIPVLYYISPQVWAWRRGRVKKMARFVDHMAVILPFEEPFYHSHRIPVTFVGHPLLDAEPHETTGAGMVKKGSPGTIGLLPGSRNSEVRALLPRMIQTAALLRAKMGHLRFRVSVAPSVDRDMAMGIIAAGGGEWLEIHSGPVSELLQGCDFALVASGTVTLEVALSATPMVIVYKVSALSYWLGRMLIRVPHIGLVNLIAGKEIVPELLQDDTAPAVLAEKVAGMLADTERLEKISENLLGIRDLLGRGGASRKVAQIARELLNR